MCLTLARPPVRRNRDRPAPGCSPTLNPRSEILRAVGMAHARPETCCIALPLDAHPRHGDAVQCIEHRPVERRAARREDDHQRCVLHRTHSNASDVSGITVLLQGGAIRRGLQLSVSIWARCSFPEKSTYTTLVSE